MMAHPDTHNSNCSIEIATAENKNEVLEFLRKFFFKDEPVNNFLGLVSCENPINEDVEAFSIEYLDNGLTLMAKYDENLVGVCMSVVIEKETKKTTVNCQDEKFAKLLKFFEYVGERADPFEQYPDCTRAVCIGIVSVDESYRGRGIAKNLLNTTSKLAKDRGCGFVTVTCTSHFTALGLKRLGFELFFSLDYADYKINNQVVLRPKSPHKSVTVYTKKV
nr:dopamine N-acetyltransferase-like [Leptinotarsa decemlineata]